MVSNQGRIKRALALGTTALLLVAACQAGTPTPAPTTTTPSTAPTTAPTTAPSTAPTSEPTTAPTSEPTTEPTAEPTPEPTAEQPTPGGTMYMLMGTNVANGGVSFQDMDPQRIYTGEDLAFFGATIMRSLTAYVYSTDPVEASGLVPDAATDTGTPNEDATSWSFTLRDGMKWQDGSPVKCEDFAYGVSRTFATDLITNGPTYAIVYLDIPTNEDGSSQYPGPYTATPEQQALFDAAVQCDGNTITFNLANPVADFNYTVTLGFSAVPNPVDHPGVDTGETYTTEPWSNGPYMISEFEAGVGGHMTMVRNPNWDASVDSYRPAYPDQWVIQFGIDPKVLDQRLISSTGDDSMAVMYGAVQPENLSLIFSDPHTALPEFEGRAFSDFDPYSRYYWIRTDKITNPQVRLAMGAALDRDAIRAAGGGEYVGDYADGVIKPNIGQDYAPTHLWEAAGPFGQDMDPTGEPELAQQLLADSGESAPTITWDYVPSPVADQIAGLVQNSLEGVGFTVNLNPISEAYYSFVLNPDTQHEFGGAGWGPDWPNASTVIPPLFTPDGGFDLSRVGPDNYPQFITDAATALGNTDRAAQATQWQALNQQVADEMMVVPTFFGLAQNLAGDGVGNLYRWGPYGSWPYAQLYVRQ